MEREISSARVAGSHSSDFSSAHHAMSLPTRAPCTKLRHSNPHTLLLWTPSTSSISGFVSGLQRLAVSAASQIQPDISSDEVSGSKAKLQLRRLLDFAGKERGFVSFSVAAQLFSLSSMLVFPQAPENVVDTKIGSSLDNLNFFAAHIGGTFVMLGIATTTRASTMYLAGSRISSHLLVKPYDTILRQDLAIFDIRKSGALFNQLSNELLLLSRPLTENIEKRN